jgi:hypothetical protein
MALHWTANEKPRRGELSDKYSARYPYVSGIFGLPNEVLKPCRDRDNDFEFFALVLSTLLDR